MFLLVYMSCCETDEVGRVESHPLPVAAITIGGAVEAINAGC